MIPWLIGMRIEKAAMPAYFPVFHGLMPLSKDWPTLTYPLIFMLLLLSDSRPLAHAYGGDRAAGRAY
jgi:hypothetical protein